MGKKSAYFVFCGAERAAAKQHCIDAADGANVSVAVVAKELGRRWEALSPEERQAYKDRATELAAEAQEAEKAQAEGVSDAAEPAEAGPAGDEAADNAGKEAAQQRELPAAAVRRIMVLDADVKRVSQQAVAAVGKATRLFVELLAAEAHSQAAGHKRHSVRFADVVAVCQRDQRLVDMGLRDVFATEAMFAAARGEGEAGRKVKQLVLPPAGVSAISTFFQTAQAHQPAVVTAE